MSARTVITHAQIQGEESAHITALRDALTVATEARRAAVDAARDMGYTIPDLHDGVRAADRAEMDAYLALFDARHAGDASARPSRGVSLGKAPVASVEGLCASVLSGRGCAHSAVMNEAGHQVACGALWVRSSWLLRSNDLDALADWFGASPRG